MAMKTEVIVENDEMEDGSIFVCFMCEKEFNKVSLLNDHMKQHTDMPELTREFPKRRGRGGRGRGEGRGVGGSGRSRGRGRGRAQSRVEPASPELLPVREVVPPKVVPPKVVPPKVVPSQAVPPKVVPPKVVPPKVVPAKNNKVPQIVIKDEPGESPADLAARKAQRIRQFFQSRIMSSVKTEKKPTISEELAMGDDDFDMPMAEDEIMMVPVPTKKTAPPQPTKRKAPPPVVMVDEPEGFSTPAPTPNKKVKLRKKLIVQEVLYEEIEEDEDGAEVVKSVTSMPGTEIIQMVSSEPPSPEAPSPGAPPRREPSSRPIKQTRDEEIYEYEEGEAEEDEVVELTDDEEAMDFLDEEGEEGDGVMRIRKPGRRTRPRNSEEGPGIPCEECGKEFRSASTLRVHWRSHLEVKSLPCPYCDEVFPQRHVLQQHLVDMHEASNNLTCSVCGKIFTRTDSLKSHMVRMHEEDGGLNCYICGKNFPSQGQLEMHVRVHTGERPFKCEYCNKGFVQKVHLRTHLRTMHNMLEIQNTPCRICNAKLDGRAGLRDHYSSVHKLTNNQYKSRVAKLRKEGKIPELPPPVVKEVDPSLNYYKVSISELTGVTETITKTPVKKSTVKRTYGSRGRGRGRPRRITISKVVDSDSSSMETTTYCDADSTYGAMEVKSEVDNDQDNPRRRDQEELNIVESAFKVAEQMDQLGASAPGSTTILVAGEDSETTGVYYAIPVVMENNSSSASTTMTTSTKTVTSTIVPSAPTSSNLDAASSEVVTTAVTSTVTANGTSMISTTTSDASSIHAVEFGQEEIDEYEQFAAEHSHMEEGNFEAETLNNKGSIVKAEPLRLFTDPDDPTQSETVEMFTM